MEEGASKTQTLLDPEKKDYAMDQYNQKVHQYYYKIQQQKGAKSLDSVPMEWIGFGKWIDKMIQKRDELFISNEALYEWILFQPNFVDLDIYPIPIETMKTTLDEHLASETKNKRYKIWSKWTLEEKQMHWIFFLFRLMKYTSCKNQEEMKQWMTLPSSFWEKKIQWSKEHLMIQTCKDMYWDEQNQSWQFQIEDVEVLETRKKVKSLIKQL
jgi:hypothetical protein